MNKFFLENSENIISTMSMLKIVSHSYWIPDPYLAFFDRKVNLVTFENIFCVEGMSNPCQKNNIIVRTRFDLNPKREWIQAHVAQTMNL